MQELSGRFLYHAGFYDGPLSGVMVRPDGSRYWFEVSEESVDDWCYWYYLYELTPAEWEFEDRRHALFQEHVGTHCDYDLKGRRNHGAIRPREEWDKFYENLEYGGHRFNTERNYTSREPIAIWDPYGERGTPSP